MKKIVLLLLLFGVVIVTESLGQDKKEMTRKERRELEKQKKAQLDSIYAIEVKQSIDNKKWVLEADRLSNKRGQTVNVNSTLNFVAIEGEEAYVQLGRNTGMGPNGVGGITVRATITKYEINLNKKGIYYINIFLTSAVGSFDVRINTNPTGQMASATISGNSSNKITYSGRIVPMSRSTVYKGISLF